MRMKRSLTPPMGDLAKKLEVAIWLSEEDGFTAYVSSLPGCIREGDTKEETLANIKEAIELYLEPVNDDLAAAPVLIP